MGFRPWKIVDVVADEIAGTLSMESLAASIGLGTAFGPAGFVAGVVIGADDGTIVRETAEIAFDATLTTLRIGEEVWTRVSDELVPLASGGIVPLFSRVGVPGLMLVAPFGFVAGVYLYDGAGRLLEMAALKVADFLGAFESRNMTDNEWSFATRIFGRTLPPRQNIHITNIGLFDKTDGSTRPFAMPLFRGNYLINFGSLYHRHDDFASTLPGLFAHEVTHVWQSKRRPLKVTIYAEAAKSTNYDFALGKQWRNYELEQQASIVEQWVEDGEDPVSPLYRYIRSNVRAGSDLANSHGYFNMDTARGIRELFNACTHYANQENKGAVVPNLHHLYTPNQTTSTSSSTAGARFGTIQFKRGDVTWMDIPSEKVGATRSRDTARGIRERFNATADWAARNGFVGGCPNLHQATYNRTKVSGTYLFDGSVAVFRDVHARDLPQIEESRDSPRGLVRRFNAAHDYAIANGFVGGFPTLHETRSGLRGLVLFKKGAATWSDCRFEELVSASGW